MEDGFAAGHGFFQGGGIAEIAGDGFGFEAFQIFEITGGANEQAEAGALLGESAGYVGA
jgi:hypothetical protein